MLRPYATKPSRRAAGIAAPPLKRSPASSATASAPAPEPKPFTITICAGSFPEIARVQLFSSPQHTAASKTNSDPLEKERLPASESESNALASVIRPMAANSRPLTRSWNSNRAMSAVATISKLFKSAAFAAVVSVSPCIRRIGAATSNSTMPKAYGQSARTSLCSFGSLPVHFRARPSSSIPAPAPR